MGMSRLFAVILNILIAHTVAASVGGDYVVGPGDVLSIQVYGEPELSLPQVRVSVDGMVAYPLLGRVAVEGQTARGIEQRLTGMLEQGYLKNARVAVSVVRYRPFYVKGAVKTPGAHEYAEDMTVEKALALAGGTSEFADTAKITLIRQDGDPEPVTLSTRLLPGDIVTVAEKAAIERAGEAARYIYLYGEVRNPGSYPYRDGLTVEKAIALAGGFGPRASKSKVDISREQESAKPEKLKRVELTAPVMPGDVITVGESWF